MKFLTERACIDKLKAPVNGHLILQAKRQEDRLTMHCEPLQNNWRARSGLNDFLMWVQKILPPKKFERFASLCTQPLETTDTTESIFDELSKFLDAPDKFQRIEFSAPAYEDEFSRYLDEVLKEDKFWRDEGMQALRSGINSFLIVDLPRIQTTPRPRPYIFVLNMCNVYDVDINTSSLDPEYLIYWDTPTEVVFLCELAYRRFKKDETTMGEWVMTHESFHSDYVRIPQPDGTIQWGERVRGLGRIPAASFWKRSITKQNLLDKRGPLTATLTKLDWLLFFKTSKKYLDTYGAWPIIVRYKEQCTYKDQDGNACEMGYVNYLDAAGTRCQKRCPVCEASIIMGPGSDWKIDPPKDKDDVNLMETPAKFIEISNDKLEYCVKETQRLEEEITILTVGAMQTDTTQEAINEKQVKYKTESKKTILNRIREQFDENKRFAYECMGRLMYDDAFIRAEVWGGSDFFLESASDLVKQYDDAKKAGMPRYEVAKIRETYITTKYQGNPVAFQRAQLLAQLEPWVDMSLADCKAIGMDVQNREFFLLKADFVNLIAQFEREQMSIIEFASNRPLSEKLSIIQKQLLEYVRKQNPAPPPEPRPEPGANG